MTAKPKFESDAFEAIHSSAQVLFKESHGTSHYIEAVKNPAPPAQLVSLNDIAACQWQRY